MFGLVKNTILNYNQSRIERLKPKVNIFLSKEIPIPSMDVIRRLSPIVSLVNSLEDKISRLTDLQLRDKTEQFKEHIQRKNKEISSEIEELESKIREVVLPEEKEKLKERLKEKRNLIFQDILPETFAVVREAARRAIGMRHFDVQILGGIILHQGKIAEMATGEGKTLVATLSAYLNALLGKGVHIITVNDYLAKRDREWMGPVYEFLGLSCGAIQHDMDQTERRYAYNCDITYGTNNEFGFDYLRDNMVIRLEDMVQRGFFYGIVDEVDSILIDEARTPLIISGPAEESTEKYYIAERISKKLKGKIITEKDEIEAKSKGIDLSKGFDYLADEKQNAISLTEEGERKAAQLWGIDNLHEISTMEYRHHTIQALKAKHFFDLDRDYVVKDGQVIIVDEFTGRLMPGRRWSDGLHQAVEAKENLKIERENQTLATITFQNYFRMYEKLAGMTGTAYTEATEFKHIYKLDTVAIPTNRPLIRTNFSDCVYKTEKEKFEAVAEEIVDWYKKGRPVLVGTISIEKSERLSEMLKRRGISHQVLNAKYHEYEAQIVAQAGRLKTITIATNMAGRGTDILLGGNPEHLTKNFLKAKGVKLTDRDYSIEYRNLSVKFKEETTSEHEKVVGLGGLHIIGTERHEARRIDNQLRGRAGRQGDPGSSRFYVSLEDDLMRLFGSNRLIGIMDRLGLEEGQRIEHPWVTKSIEIAQKRVEQHNFEIRKQLLEFDNVMNKQREVIYNQRHMVLEGKNLKEEIFSYISDLLERVLNMYLAPETPYQEWNFEGLKNHLRLKFGLILEEPSIKDKKREEIKDFIFKEMISFYEEKEISIGREQMRELERRVFLQVIDSKWKDHLYTMDNLREGIGLRAYGQRDPLVEYRNEAFSIFQDMIEKIKEDVIEYIFKIQLIREERLKGVFVSLPQEFIHQEISRFERPEEEPSAIRDSHPGPSLAVTAPPKKVPKVGRNDPCPCGSGKKYKKCCGR